ncbi:helix-turn-helix domain-containing protein [Shewanella gelidii]|uniref:IS481 family transposase n=1 Tax=Shewanella gelidii TaxID=1642821 RepID=A0A917JV21_9GAMM|nr:helix-turn-helix domain-containing protein [Shewanella gelidii]MCL1098795.1 helix-turn-helix domain-containing protein [Shewanella gelidii]GGI87617.1 IS481 family transposase [Shewanella gelidii]
MNNKESKQDIRNKLALLQLAKELGSVSKACEIMGYSRDSYYRFKRQYEQVGEQGLRNLSRKKPALKNRVSAEVEEQVIEIALDYPNYGQAKAAEILTARGCKISASGVRAIWVRHNLETKKNRLNALQSALRQQSNLANHARSQTEQLYRLKQTDDELECLYPGNVCVQDTFAVGEFEGIGMVYQHTFVDAYSQFAHAKLSLSNDSQAAADFLLKHVAPDYVAKGLPIEHLLTDKGVEFFGKKSQPFKDVVAKIEANHVHMRAYNGPVVNGLGARFHRLIWDNFYESLIKTQRLNALAEIDAALQAWLQTYNGGHGVAGRYTLGRAPEVSLQLGLHLVEPQGVALLKQVIAA